MPKEREPVRKIILNPAEPRTGDHAFQLARKADPQFGERDTVNNLRSQFKGLRGETIRVRLHGFSVRANGTRKAFSGLEREITLNKYSDIFGPSGVYDSMLYEGFRAQESSDDTTVATNITVEVL